MHILAVILLPLAAGDDQQILLCRDVDLVLAETGDGKGDPIFVITAPLEVERRVVFGSRERRG
jgi:hypothetical protein